MTALSGPLHPKDLIDMAHSPAYFTAAGIRDHAFGWVHASPEKIADPVIHALIDKVSVGPEPTDNLVDYRQGASVSIVTMDGRTVSNTVFVPKGAGCLGIDWADVDTKFRALAPNAPMSEGQIARSIELVHDFREISGLSEFIKGLHV
jgi:2-methylcitrate dehydratase PrpD